MCLFKHLLRGRHKRDLQRLQRAQIERTKPTEERKHSSVNASQENKVSSFHSFWIAWQQTSSWWLYHALNGADDFFKKIRTFWIPFYLFL